AGRGQAEDPELAGRLSRSGGLGLLLTLLLDPLLSGEERLLEFERIPLLADLPPDKRLERLKPGEIVDEALRHARPVDSKLDPPSRLLLLLTADALDPALDVDEILHQVGRLPLRPDLLPDLRLDGEERGEVVVEAFGQCRPVYP